MKFILGKKIEMSQIFKNDGTVAPVTIVQAGPCLVTQIKTRKKDGYNAVQIGFMPKKRINKPLAGHLQGLEKFGYLAEFRDKIKDIKRGDEIKAKIFEPGERIKITGVSKGKGFQGVVKRHGFHGSPATHGHKDQLRMPGSIGATNAARVFPGTRMPGRMGGEQVTVANLEVVKVEPEKNLLYIKGAVPGARNSLLKISALGEMKLNKVKQKLDKVEDEKETKKLEIEKQMDEADRGEVDKVNKVVNKLS